MPDVAVNLFSVGEEQVERAFARLARAGDSLERRLAQSSRTHARAVENASTAYANAERNIRRNLTSNVAASNLLARAEQLRESRITNATRARARALENIDLKYKQSTSQIKTSAAESITAVRRLSQAETSREDRLADASRKRSRAVTEARVAYNRSRKGIQDDAADTTRATNLLARAEEQRGERLRKSAVTRTRAEEDANARYLQSARTITQSTKDSEVLTNRLANAEASRNQRLERTGTDHVRRLQDANTAYTNATRLINQNTESSTNATRRLADASRAKETSIKRAARIETSAIADTNAAYERTARNINQNTTTAEQATSRLARAERTRNDRRVLAEQSYAQTVADANTTFEKSSRNRGQQLTNQAALTARLARAEQIRDDRIANATRTRARAEEDAQANFARTAENAQRAGTTSTRALNQAAQSTSRFERGLNAVNRQLSTVGRRFRSVFTVTAALQVLLVVHQIGRGIAFLITQGIGFNMFLEQNAIALSAILGTTRELTIANGQAVSAILFYPVIYEEARRLQKEIVLLSVETIGTAEDLTGVYQRILAFTAQQKATDEERLQLSSNLLNIARLIGLNETETLIEIRQITTLETNRGQAVLQVLGLNIKQLRNWKEQGELVQRLNTALEPIRIIAQEIGNSFLGVSESVKSLIAINLGTVFQDSFRGLGDILRGARDRLTEILEQGPLVQILGLSTAELEAFGAKLADILINVGTYLADAINSITEFTVRTPGFITGLTITFQAIELLLSGVARAFARVFEFFGFLASSTFGQTIKTIFGDDPVVRAQSRGARVQQGAGQLAFASAAAGAGGGGSGFGLESRSPEFLSSRSSSGLAADLRNDARAFKESIRSVGAVLNAGAQLTASYNRKIVGFFRSQDANFDTANERANTFGETLINLFEGVKEFVSDINRSITFTPEERAAQEKLQQEFLPGLFDPGVGLGTFVKELAASFFENLGPLIISTAAGALSGVSVAGVPGAALGAGFAAAAFVGPSFRDRLQGSADRTSATDRIGNLVSERGIENLFISITARIERLNEILAVDFSKLNLDEITGINEDILEIREQFAPFRRAAIEIIQADPAIVAGGEETQKALRERIAAFDQFFKDFVALFTNRNQALNELTRQQLRALNTIQKEVANLETQTTRIDIIQDRTSPTAFIAARETQIENLRQRDLLRVGSLEGGPASVNRAAELRRQNVPREFESLLDERAAFQTGQAQFDAQTDLTALKQVTAERQTQHQLVTQTLETQQRSLDQELSTLRDTESGYDRQLEIVEEIGRVQQSQGNERLAQLQDQATLDEQNLLFARKQLTDFTVIRAEQLQLLLSSGASGEQLTLFDQESTRQLQELSGGVDQFRDKLALTNGTINETRTTLQLTADEAVETLRQASVAIVNQQASRAASRQEFESGVNLGQLRRASSLRATQLELATQTADIQQQALQQELSLLQSRDKGFARQLEIVTRIGAIEQLQGELKIRSLQEQITLRQQELRIAEESLAFSATQSVQTRSELVSAGASPRELQNFDETSVQTIETLKTRIQDLKNTIDLTNGSIEETGAAMIRAGKQTEESLRKISTVTVNIGAVARTSIREFLVGVSRGTAKVGDFFANLGDSIRGHVTGGLADALTSKLDFDLVFERNVISLGGIFGTFGTRVSEVFQGVFDKIQQGFAAISGQTIQAPVIVGEVGPQLPAPGTPGGPQGPPAPGTPGTSGANLAPAAQGTPLGQQLARAGIEIAGLLASRPIREFSTDVGGGSSQARTGANIGGFVGSTGGRIVGTAFGGPIGGAIGAFVGDFVGSFFGALFGGLFAPGRIAAEKKKIRNYFDDILSFDPSFRNQPGAAKGTAFVPGAPDREALEFLGAVYADKNLRKNDEQGLGTVQRFANQFFNAVFNRGLSVEQQREEINSIRESQNINTPQDVLRVFTTFDREVGPDEYQENVDEGLPREARVTRSDVLTGGIQLLTNFDERINAAAVANNFLADSFAKLRPEALETIEAIRNGSIDVEEALLKYGIPAGSLKIDEAEFLAFVELASQGIDALTERVNNFRKALQDIEHTQVNLDVNFTQTLINEGFLDPDAIIAPLQARRDLYASNEEEARGRLPDLASLDVTDDAATDRALGTLNEVLNALEARGQALLAIFKAESAAIDARIETLVAARMAAIDAEVAAVREQIAVVEAVTDAIRDQVKAIDEQIKGIDRQIKAIDKRAGAVQDQIKAIDLERDAINDLIKAIDKRADAVTKEIKGIDRERDAINDLIEAIDKRADAVTKEIKGIDLERSLINDQIEAIDKRAGAVQDEIRGIDKQTTAITKQIPAINKQTAAITAQISAIDNQIKELQTTVKAFEQVSLNAQKAIDSIVASVSTAPEQEAAVQRQLADQETELRNPDLTSVERASILNEIIALSSQQVKLLQRGDPDAVRDFIKNVILPRLEGIQDNADTTSMTADTSIEVLQAEKDAQIAAKDILIAEKDNLIAAKDILIAEKDNLIARRDEIIAEKDVLFAQRDILDAKKDILNAKRDEIIAEKDNLISAKDILDAEKDILIARRDEIIAEKDVLFAERDILDAKKDELIVEKDLILAEKDVLFAQREELLENKNVLLEKIALQNDRRNVLLDDIKVIELKRNEEVAGVNDLIAEKDELRNQFLNDITVINEAQVVVLEEMRAILDRRLAAATAALDQLVDNPSSGTDTGAAETSAANERARERDERARERDERAKDRAEATKERARRERESAEDRTRTGTGARVNDGDGGRTRPAGIGARVNAGDGGRTRTAGSGARYGINAVPAQTGLFTTVRQPTLIRTGEGGFPEDVLIRPHRQGGIAGGEGGNGGGGGGGVTINITNQFVIGDRNIGDATELAAEATEHMIEVLNEQLRFGEARIIIKDEILEES